MSAFIFANVDVTDPAGFATYRELVAPTVSAAGGRYRVRGGETRQLEGSYAPRRTVLLEFDSMAVINCSESVMPHHTPPPGHCASGPRCPT